MELNCTKNNFRKIQKVVDKNIVLCYYNINKKETNKWRNKKMNVKVITIDNTTITKKVAIKEAKEYNDQTGLDVIVCNMIGDVVFSIRNGNEYRY